MTGEQDSFWSVFDRLNDKWIEAERAMKKLIIKVSECPLSLEKYDGKMRILYEEQPVTNLPVRKRIEAAKHLKQFIKVYENVQNESLEQAEQAICLLDDFIAKIKSAKSC